MKSLFFLAAFLLISPQLAFSHALLMKTVPADGALLDEAPRSVSLSFLGYIEHLFSKVEVFDAGGNKVSKKAEFTDGDEGTEMKAELRDGLPAGEYRVMWKCLGKDGHKQKGSLRFTIK